MFIFTPEKLQFLLSQFSHRYWLEKNRCPYPEYTLSLPLFLLISLCIEVGIYKRKQERKKTLTSKKASKKRPRKRESF